MNAYLLTFGCQMNEYDSEILESLLAGRGYNIVGDPDDAELIVVNTCSVRQKAEERAMARITALSSLKEIGKAKVIIVAGCMAKRAGNELLAKIPAIDYVIGPDRIPDIPDIIEQGESPRVLVDEGEDGDKERFIKQLSGPKAFLAISRGCENYCSYCIVPFVRGSFRCRPVESIMRQFKGLIESGAKEITLLGQNVNSYRDGSVDFPRLLRMLDSEAKCRLRFLTSHPKDMSDELANCFAELPNLCHAIHLPLQSGSNKILRSMNRGYTVERYMGLIEKLRKAAPDITLSTDIIVGFPGETEEDFEQTIAAVKEIEFDSAFMFRYSVRPGTAAAALADDVPEHVKIERLNHLIAVQQQISDRKLQYWVGKTVEVLIVGRSRRKPPMPAGIARGGQKVLIKNVSNLALGQLVEVKITESKGKTLFGELQK